MGKNKTNIKIRNNQYSKYLRWLGLLGFLGFTGFIKFHNGQPLYTNIIFFTFFSFFIYFDFREESDERMKHNWKTANEISLLFLAVCFLGAFILIKVNPWYFKIEYLKITTIEIVVSVVFTAYHLVKTFSFYYLDKVK